MITADRFCALAATAGFTVLALHALDTSLPHAPGEPSALVAIAPDTGLAHGGFNPHEPTTPWFLREEGLNLAQEAEADAFYGSLC